MDDYEVSDDFEEEFYEGKSAFAMHRRVERNKKLRKSLLSKLKDEELVCEICGLSKPGLERSIHESLFEVHHILPLSDVDGTRATKIGDVALLCACCHRAIHKLIALEKKFVGIQDARKILVNKG